MTKSSLPETTPPSGLADSSGKPEGTVPNRAVRTPKTLHFANAGFASAFGKRVAALGFLPVYCFAALAIALFGIWSGWSTWIDDAYISMRYAWMLAAGEGLVFNPGERVEGYTNFLWCVVLAFFQRLAGLTTDTTVWVKVFGASLYLSMIGAILLANPRSASLPERTCSPEGEVGESNGVFEVREVSPRALGLWMLLMAGYSPFAAYSVMGLETIAVAFTVTCAFVFWFRAGHPTWITLFCFGLTAFLRFDGLILMAAGFLVSWIHWCRLRRPWIGFVRIALPVVVPYAVYQVWRILYYGDWFPNTYYAKIAVQAAMEPAPAVHLYFFLWLGFAWLLPVLVAKFFFDWRSRPILASAFLFSLVFQVYLLRLPLDWMPFGRFQLPLVPLFLLLMAHATDRGMILLRRIGCLRNSCVLAFALVMGCYMTFFEPLTRPSRRDVFVVVRDGLGEYAEFLRHCSRTLNFFLEPDDVVATDIAGAPAYYTRGRLLDTWGLVDRTIGREGRLLRQKDGSVALWGRVHPEYVAARRPEFMLIVGIGSAGKVPWRYVPPALLAAEPLAIIPGFLEDYRVGRIIHETSPPLYIHFLQRLDIPDRHPSSFAPSTVRIEYEPPPYSATREFVRTTRTGWHPGLSDGKQSLAWTKMQADEVRPPSPHPRQVRYFVGHPDLEESPLVVRVVNTLTGEVLHENEPQRPGDYEFTLPANENPYPMRWSVTRPFLEHDQGAGARGVAVVNPEPADPVEVGAASE